MAFTAKASNMDFFETAPIKLSFDVDIHNTTPEAVFEIIKRPETWPHWFPDMTKAKWLSGNQTANRLGAKRKVTLSHIIHFEEEFLQWEPPYNIAYQINKVSIPFCDELVEMFNISEIDDGVRVTFKIGLRLHKALRPAKLALLPVLKKTYKKIPESLKAYIES